VFRFFSALAALAALAAAAPAGAQAPAPEHEIYGIVTRIGATSIVIERRNGSLTAIDVAPAQARETTGVLYVNRPVRIDGRFDRAGRFHAESIRSWYGLRHGVWPADR
jgi:hypothetical protein